MIKKQTFVIIVLVVLAAAGAVTAFMIMKPKADTTPMQKETPAAPVSNGEPEAQSLNTRRNTTLAANTAAEVQKILELYFADNVEYPQTRAALQKALTTYGNAQTTYTQTPTLIESAPTTATSFTYFSCQNGMYARIAYWNYSDNKTVYTNVGGDTEPTQCVLVN